MAILTPEEYAKDLTLNKKKRTVQTIRTWCREGLLPSQHKARLLSRGVWAIQVPDKAN